MERYSTDEGYEERIWDAEIAAAERADWDDEAEAAEAALVRDEQAEAERWLDAWNLDEENYPR